MHFNGLYRCPRQALVSVSNISTTISSQITAKVVCGGMFLARTIGGFTSIGTICAVSAEFTYVTPVLTFFSCRFHTIPGLLLFLVTSKAFLDDPSVSPIGLVHWSLAP